jgi:hypothetical protein
MDTPEQQIKNDHERKARAAIEGGRGGPDHHHLYGSSYGDQLDVLPKSPQLRDLLCKISAASLKSEGILLSAVVVNADSEQKGIPGSGFFEFAAGKGFEFSNERTFWDMRSRRYTRRIQTPDRSPVLLAGRVHSARDASPASPRPL